MATQGVEPSWLTVQGVQLEVVARGQGRPIVLLHGEEGLDPQAPFLDLLATHGRVLAPCHPSFGHSPAVDTLDTVADLVYLYLWVIADELGLEVMVNERHQTATNLTPFDPIIMGILARDG